MSNNLITNNENDEFSALFGRPTVCNNKNLDEVFGDFTLDEELSIKLDEISADLTVMMLEAKKNRTELAKSLGWKKSRITKILSGEENLTIKTIFLIAKKLDFDYDIVYRHPKQERAMQPWHSSSNKYLASVEVNHKNSPPLVIQSHHEVANDFSSGKQKNFYVSIDHDYAFFENNIIEVESTFIDHDFNITSLLKIEEDQRQVRTATTPEELIYEKI